jgi:hypothetical protein
MNRQLANCFELWFDSVQEILDSRRSDDEKEAAQQRLLQVGRCRLTL